MSAAQRSRLPGAVNLTAGVVILILVAVVALRVSASPPPSIAEFAPQPQKNIAQAPGEQSSAIGNGNTPSGLGSSQTPPAVPSPTPLGAGVRLLRCVGDPPRQIEDPQSPPCVPYWSGDNGGATAKGVTRDEVRIVVPMAAIGGV